VIQKTHFADDDTLDRLLKLEEENKRLAAYAEELRKIIVGQILAFDAAMYGGSARKLEDAMDKADAIVGKGPYAPRTIEGGL